MTEKERKVEISFGDFGIWLLIAVALIWGFGGQERFDCSVLQIEGACAKVSAEYKPKPPETPAKSGV